MIPRLARTKFKVRTSGSSRVSAAKSSSQGGTKLRGIRKNNSKAPAPGRPYWVSRALLPFLLALSSLLYYIGAGDSSLSFPLELIDNAANLSFVIAGASASPPYPPLKEVEEAIPSPQYNFSISTDYQNPLIQQLGCSVTVLLMDPSIGAGSLWALESASEYVQPHETTCIMLHTSVCNEGSYEQKATRIQAEAQPFFRQMIRQGQVRMKVLDHAKYNLKSCWNFYSPSYAWQNYYYWGDDEFSKLDSDIVITIQADVALCRPLDIRLWQDAAWVGSPWPAKMCKASYCFCSSLPRFWKDYHHALPEAEIPPYPTEEELCNNVHMGLQGNGGYTIRKRSWLRKAILHCPTLAAGENITIQNCDARSTVAEDVYFVTVLKGMGAPLPNVFDAGLFGWEARSLAETRQRYDITNSTWMMERLEKRWTRTAIQTIQNEGLTITDSSEERPLVPIGIHKPFSQFFANLLCNKEIHRQCKYMRPIVENNKGGIAGVEWRKSEGHPPCFDDSSLMPRN